MEYVAGAARFVTCSQLAVAGDPLKPFPQLRQIIREAFERVGLFAPAGNTAIVIDSLCTSIPR
jgi:hypothetical protein